VSPSRHRHGSRDPGVVALGEGIEARVLLERSARLTAAHLDCPVQLLQALQVEVLAAPASGTREQRLLIDVASGARRRGQDVRLAHALLLLAYSSGNVTRTSRWPAVAQQPERHAKRVLHRIAGRVVDRVAGNRCAARPGAPSHVLEVMRLDAQLDLLAAPAARLPRVKLGATCNRSLRRTLQRRRPRRPSRAPALRVRRTVRSSLPAPGAKPTSRVGGMAVTPRARPACAGWGGVATATPYRGAGAPRTASSYARSPFTLPSRFAVVVGVGDHTSPEGRRKGPAGCGELESAAPWKTAQPEPSGENCFSLSL